MAVERLQVGGGAQALSHVGACWVVGMHVVLSGHVVAGEATVTVGHLLHTRIHKIRDRMVFTGCQGLAQKIWVSSMRTEYSCFFTLKLQIKWEETSLKMKQNQKIGKNTISRCFL